MKITLSGIEALNPCKDRIENFRVRNPELKEFSVETFLGLDNITYSDKIWVMTILMNKNQKIKWAVACAWSVLELFEKKYPNDKRPRELLQYMTTIEDYSILTELERQNIRNLRNAAATDAASADAAAAYTAAYAADADAIDTVVYAADAAAAYTAAYAANAAAYAAYTADADAYTAYTTDAYAADTAAYAARKVQQDLNLLLMLEVLKN